MQQQGMMGQQNPMGGGVGMQPNQQQPMVGRYSHGYQQQNYQGPSQSMMQTNSSSNYGQQHAPLPPPAGGGLVIQQPPASGLVVNTMSAPGPPQGYGQQSATQQPLYLTQNSLSLPPPPRPHPLLTNAAPTAAGIAPAGASYLAVQSQQPQLPSTTLLPQLSQHQPLHTANSVGPLVVQQPAPLAPHTASTALPLVVSSAGLPAVTTVTNATLATDPLQQQQAAAAANLAAQAAAAA